MNKHTPGPWLPSKFGFQVLTGDSWNTICTLKGGAEWEDGRGSYIPEYEWQNQEANARLIAAAPAMLDLIQWIETWVSNPAGAYSTAALDGLFGMTRDRIAALSSTLRDQDAAQSPQESGR